MRLQNQWGSILLRAVSDGVRASARRFGGVWRRLLMRREHPLFKRTAATGDSLPPAVRVAIEEQRQRRGEHMSLEGIAALVDEGTVPAGSRLEKHLTQCDQCRREYDAIRQLVTTVATLPVIAPPELTMGHGEFTFTFGGGEFERSIPGAPPRAARFPRPGVLAKDTEERTLVERAKQNDDDACRLLYTEHSGYVFRQIRRLVSDEDLADELSQDSWRRIFEKLALFDYRSSFRTWAATVARNVVLNRQRSRPTESLDESVLQSEDNEPDAILIDRLTGAERIERAVARLPQIQRAVLLLHDRFSLSHIEIAAAFGIDAGTSRSNLHKARARVRKELGGVDPREDA
jgi:RNA polymerase sigma-70 factor, ECF subfamily